MTQFEKIIKLFEQHNIEYIIIGGYAAAIHGSARLTSDIDFVYKRSQDNIKKIAQALKDHHPYLRGAPEGLPFRFDEITISQGLNFTLKTDLGSIDLLAEIPGGNYETINPYTIEVDLYSNKVNCVNLKKLIELKKASGRPKDLEVLSELELLLLEGQDA
ncbi:MAG: hypothetical protein H7A23_16270 [Leptospiraceae bacterium]|nr:hypothetical protein [Leptospiraceae bacterium]MCP5496103.1 hypothetical protein [Leptospiraceae bacterium]